MLSGNPNRLYLPVTPHPPIPVHLVGYGTIRPRSDSATVFGRIVPNFMDVSAKKDERFDQKIRTIRPKI